MPNPQPLLHLEVEISEDEINGVWWSIWSSGESLVAKSAAEAQHDVFERVRLMAEKNVSTVTTVTWEPKSKIGALVIKVLTGGRS